MAKEPSVFEPLKFYFIYEYRTAAMITLPFSILLLLVLGFNSLKKIIGGSCSTVNCCDRLTTELVGAFTAVPSCFMLLFFYGSDSFSHYECFSFQLCLYSPPFWERAASSVYQLTHLLTDVASGGDFFALYIARNLGSDCIGF